MVFENIMYNIYWYAVKVYTYISKYFTQENSSCDDNEKLIKYKNNDSCLSYQFIAAEIIVDSETIIIDNIEDYMLENTVTFGKSFVIEYLLKSGQYSLASNIEKNNIDYKIVLMDNNSNFITLEKTDSLFLGKNNYSVSNSNDGL